MEGSLFSFRIKKAFVRTWRQIQQVILLQPAFSES